MNIGIVGAGIIGRLLAHKLAKDEDKNNIVLFDKDTYAGAASCSMTAAGLLAPYAEIETSELLISQLGQYSIAQWPKIIADLSQAVYFQQTGAITLVHPQDKADLDQLIAHLHAKNIYHDDYIICNRDTLQQYEPELAHRFDKAIYFRKEAHLSPSSLMQALEKALLSLPNVVWHSQMEVTTLHPGRIVLKNNDHYDFDYVVDCRGLGAKTDLPLRGVRGEIIWLDAIDVHIKHPIRLLHPRYPLYIVPQGNNQYVIGASFIESEDFSPISLQTALELLSSAYSIHSGFAEARITKTLVNCRPAFSNHLPKIIINNNLMHINGLYRYGYSVAPALLECALAIIKNKKEEILFPDLIQS